MHSRVTPAMDKVLSMSPSWGLGHFTDDAAPPSAQPLDAPHCTTACTTA
ncbi:MAG: hypothetical protein LBV00_10430 [Propionibacteriaceae bacterium]|nr:hypothetical protein [Propionibacteriaceae bacterium]